MTHRVPPFIEDLLAKTTEALERWCAEWPDGAPSVAEWDVLVRRAEAAEARCGVLEEALRKKEAPDFRGTLVKIGAVDRKATLGKHSASNYGHLREIVQNLDERGEIEAADTLIWMVWWSEFHSSRFYDAMKAARTPLSVSVGVRVAALVRALQNARKDGSSKPKTPGAHNA